MGGEQRGIDPATCGPLPFGALLLDLALKLWPFGVQQPDQPLLRLAHTAGTPQPLQPVEPAGRCGGLVVLVLVCGCVIPVGGSQLLQRCALRPLPQQESQQILAKGHQPVMGLCLQHMGEIPLVQYGDLGALLPVPGKGAEIEPEVTPVQLFQRQLKGVEQTDRLTMTITGPLTQQIRQQRKLITQTALPLLALLAGDHGVSLLQPTEPEQSTEHQRPLPLGTLCLPLAQGTEQPFGKGLLSPLLRQLLQGGPVCGDLAGKVTTEPLPFGGEPFAHAFQLGGTGAGNRCERPLRPGLCIEQHLQGEVHQHQLLPLRAGARQQAMGIGHVEQAKQIGRKIVGRHLTRLTKTELAYQRLRHLLAGDRGHPCPVRHGAGS